MSDFDVRDYGASSGSAWVKKADLRANGPRRFVIQTVEEGAGFPDKNGNPTKELVLIFTDGMKQALRAQVNKDRMREMYGPRTSKWAGKEIELYVDLGVRGPRGEEGGVRIRRPDAREENDELEGYVSDLDEASVPLPIPEPPVKGNGGLSMRPRSKGKSA